MRSHQPNSHSHTRHQASAHDSTLHTPHASKPQTPSSVHKRDPQHMSEKEVNKRLKRLRRTATWLDACMTVPCTCNRVRFGVESLVGLVPVIGDFAGVVMALVFISAICGTFHTPASIKVQMFLNVALDFIVGLVPLLGDIFDIMFKANIRNMDLIESHVRSTRTSMQAIEMGTGATTTAAAAGGPKAPVSAYIPRVPIKKGAGRKVLERPVGSATYFDVLLGKDATFDVDIGQLRRKFLRLQQAVHPDSFSQREDTERRLAEAQSAWINHAYATLKDPLQRAHYLLELSGRAVREEDQATDPELLMEVMETREQIEAATSSEQIASLQRHNEAEIAAEIRELSQAFAVGDLDSAQRGANRLQYLRRAGQAIHAWEPGKRVVVPH
ncbi:molecular chaperone [Coemansia sp. RSA 2336]|nr:molecular chaperone [Coemansia sp. RSA 2336]